MCVCVCVCLCVYVSICGKRVRGSSGCLSLFVVDWPNSDDESVLY